MKDQKPKGYWTKERCHQEALKYSQRSEFLKGSGNAWKAAQRNGWLDEICAHMGSARKPDGYWTKQRCHQEARKYTTRTAFVKSSASAYRIAQRNNWLDDICGHMTSPQKPSGYWTKKRCADEAAKYSTRNEFHKSSGQAYRAAQRNGWLEEICSEMEYETLPRHFWTKEKCAHEALKYSLRTEFQKGSGSAWGAAQREGWLDEICSHMVAVDHGWKHCIYAIINKKLNEAYIGLTRQAFDVRMAQHKSDNNTTNSAVISNDPDTQFIQLTGYDYLVSEVGDKEKEFVDRYKAEGFDVLNDERWLGQIGTQTHWTEERCHEEALKYTSRSEFRKQSNNTYIAARKHGFLEKICSHMIADSRKPSGYWTKSRCHKEALKYKTRGEFRDESKAYPRALAKGWLDAICQHMTSTRAPVGFWNDKERCAEEAKKYDSRGEFEKGSNGAYRYARKNQWLDEICSHMAGAKPNNYWTKERCHQEALKYQTRTAFQNGSSRAYSAARKKHWLDEICSHMYSPQKSSGYWTVERCRQEAVNYSTKTEFREGSGGAYMAAKRHGCLEEICSHMKSDRVPRGYWDNKERCLEEALKCQTRSEFKRKCRGAHASARKQGWLDEVCQHMD